MSAVPPSPQAALAEGTPPADGRLVTSRGPLVSASMAVVAVVSYIGTLVLAHLLDPPEYSQYAAAATLLGTVGVFAAALIPLPLTHVIRSHPHGSEERRRGMAFAWAVSAVGGTLAAVATGLLTAAFAPPRVAAVVAVAALVLFLCSPVWGWLDGELLFVRDAGIVVTEVCVRVLVGVGVVLAGVGAGGALLGFVAGSALVLLATPRRLWRDLAWRPRVLRERGRWAEAGDIAVTQLVVYSLIGADVVVVALLADPDATSAGFQALSTLAKAPVYVAAGAVTVAFPLLRSRQADTGSILTATLRSFTVLAVSSAAVVATVPRELMLLVFPQRYEGSLALLPVLATAGVGYAAITMFATVMLGLRAYRRCQAGLLAALALLPLGMLVGWQVAEVSGLAWGAALAALLSAAALGVACAPMLPPGTFGRVPRGLLFAVAVFALLALTRPVPALWVAAVLAVGVAVLQLSRRPGAEPAPADPLESR